jgi:hypothetical protein
MLDKSVQQEREPEMAIDTLAYVRALEAAGLDRKVAEAHVAALRENILPELATKQDMKDLRPQLRKEIWTIALGVTLGAIVLAIAIQTFVD